MSKAAINPILRDALTKLPVDQQRALARHSAQVMSALVAHLGIAIRLSEGDKLRIIRWRSWAEKYDVTLTYVIETAFAWGDAVSNSRGSRPQRNVKVLPLGIPALTGDACRQYVAEQSLEDGVRGYNTEKLRAIMLQDELGDKLPPAFNKTMLDYPDLDAYTKAYELNSNLRRSALARAEAVLAKSKPFRGNPFR